MYGAFVQDRRRTLSTCTVSLFKTGGGPCLPVRCLCSRQEEDPVYLYGVFVQDRRRTLSTCTVSLFKTGGGPCLPVRCLCSRQEEDPVYLYGVFVPDRRRTLSTCTVSLMDMTAVVCLTLLPSVCQLSFSWGSWLAVAQTLMSRTFFVRSEHQNVP